eukprot:2327783-Pleurochrysis_carterae.AAC.1
MHRAKLRGAAAAARRRVLAVHASHGDANLLTVLTPRSTVPPLLLLHIENCAVETCCSTTVRLRKHRKKGG